MAIYYVNGKYVEDNYAALPLSDIAILRGFGVFDYLRTYNGKPFHLEDHFNRLKNSAGLLQLNCPWSFSEISEIVEELLLRNKFWETNLRFIITGGDSIDSITPSNSTRLVVMATEVQPFPNEWYQNGVKVITSDVTRYIPGAKSIDYTKAIMVLRNARQASAIESIYVNENGNLLEGTTSNLFAVFGDKIVTPTEDILPGITRQVVISLAEKTFPLELGVIDRKDLDSCTELFITSSNKEVIPVIQIDDRQVSSEPGNVTKDIMKLFRQYTQL